MPIVENHAEHPFHLPPQSVVVERKDEDKRTPLDVKPVVYQDALLFPRAGAVNEEGDPVPSKTKVTAEQLKRLRGNPITASWFKPKAGKLQLRVAEGTADEEAPATGGKTSLGSVGGNQGAEVKKQTQEKSPPA